MLSITADPPPPPPPAKPFPPLPWPVPPEPPAVSGWPSAPTVTARESSGFTKTVSVVTPPSPPAPNPNAAPPLPPTAVMVRLLTPPGTVTKYVPGVVEENSVAGVADAGPVMRAVVAARENVVSPPITSDPASTDRRLLRRRLSIERHPSPRLPTRTPFASTVSLLLPSPSPSALGRVRPFSATPPGTGWATPVVVRCRDAWVGAANHRESAPLRRLGECGASGDVNLGLWCRRHARVTAGWTASVC